jgi:alpha-glucosidase
MLEVAADGVSGFWTDMNEPATWGQRVPNILEFEMEGRGGSHREAHNLYGLAMAQATSEGAELARPGLRPFVLTRAGFSGVQRYAAVWTGDNVADDKHMLLGSGMLNSMGLSGIGFCGTDIGGFVGNGNEKLFARWLTIGAFSPLCRIHSMIDSRDSEPWAYGEKVEAIARNYISLRYKLLPYYYSLFKNLEETGIPVQRSLVLTDAGADQTYKPAFQNQFLIGDFLLVAPVSADQDFTEVFVPKRGNDSWYYLFTDDSKKAGETILKAPLEFLPILVAPGAIIPMRSVVQHEGDPDDGFLTLHLYKGSTNTTFDFYWDEGDGYAYKEGVFHRRLIAQFPSTRTIVIDRATGSMVLPWQKLRLLLHGYSDASQLSINNLSYTLEEYQFRFLEPLPNFDPFGNDTSALSCHVKVLELAYTFDILRINY